MTGSDSSGDQSNSHSSRRQSVDAEQQTQPARRGGKSAGRLSGRSRPRASLACMNCRQRKIKCNVPNSTSARGPGPGTPCTSCRSLQIPCVVSRDGDRRKAGSREQVSALQDRLQFLESLVTPGQGAAAPTGHEVRMPYDVQHAYNASLTSPVRPNAGEVPANNQPPPSDVGPQFSPTEQRHNSLTLNSPPISDVSGPLQPPSLNAGHVTPNCAMKQDQRLHVSSRPAAISDHHPTEIRIGRTTDAPPILRNPFASGLHQPTPLGIPENVTRDSSNSSRCNQDYVSSGYETTSPAQQYMAITPSSDQDGSRLNLDENYGRPRYYGPTSQLYIQRRSIAEDGEALAGYNEPPNDLNMDSGPVRNMIFRIFWRTQPNSVIVVDEPLFETSRALGSRSEYYSAFLENALLACASRLSTSEDVRRLGRHYAARSKADIAQELEEPNIATLQGFLLLSDFEATRGRDRLGYMYCGIACRLVFDLGLPESCDELVSQGKLSALEASARHTLFLGTFVFDKLWSLYLGRPSSISVRTLEKAHKRCLASGWTGPDTLSPWIGLCTDMSEVADILNNSWPLDFAARNRLADMDRRICSRFESLPPSLMLYDGRVSDLPITAYGLHIQFYGLRIVLHRLSSKAVAQEAVDQHINGYAKPGERELAQSRAIMQESAVSIARLVAAYQQICGIENAIVLMLDNVYVAAAVLISHHLRPSAEGTSLADQRNLQWLRSLADMLHDVQKHYPVTARMRATLSSFVDKTSLAGMFGPTSGLTGMTEQFFPTDGQRTPRDNGATAGSSNMNGMRRQEVEMFENCFSENGPPLFQDMDLNNMMSWMLSPTMEKG